MEGSLRTLLVGLIGGALVFTFFWYRGDVGVITVPVLGELAPPAATAGPANAAGRVLERLATLRADARAVRAEFAPREPLVDLNGDAPEIYAGQLIAKPIERPADAAPPDEVAEDVAADAAAGALESRMTQRSLAAAPLSARAVSAPAGLSSALAAANEVGVVDTTIGGGAMIINLDYDLIDEVAAEPDAAPAPPTEPGQLRALRAPRAIELAPSVAPMLSEDQAAAASAAAQDVARRLAARAAVTEARPLAFNAGETIRDRAMRSQARRLRWAQSVCPADVDAALLRENPQIGVSCAIQRLRESGEFEYVEPNMIVTHELARRPTPTPVGVQGPDDPLFGYQWNYRDQGGDAGQSVGGASFETFWSRAGQGSNDIVVAVVDTGLDMEHPDIRNSPNVAQGVDMVSVPFYGNDGDGRDLNPDDPGDICDPSDPEAQDSYHGTHVAGTIGAVATNDGEGVAGGAWNVTIVPVRALGRCGGLQSDINDAIRWAAGVEPAIIETADGAEAVFNENPADIINLSLGFRAPDGCPRSTQEAIDDAVAAGAIVVAAAGNAGINVDGYGPSGCENVITVAAGDALGALAYYSNWGDKVDVMAPGGDLRVDADGDGRPDGILSTKHSANCIDPVNNQPITECNYSYENGTSMAAPHVSAALALLKSQDPSRSNQTLMDEIVNVARQPRTTAQCVGLCDETPGGEEVAGQPGMCHRACGNGLLDLSLAAP
jgi:subtilisin family serine protease